jgi:hypothetical protein
MTPGCFTKTGKRCRKKKGPGEKKEGEVENKRTTDLSQGAKDLLLTSLEARGMCFTRKDPMRETRVHRVCLR